MVLYALQGLSVSLSKNVGNIMRSTLIVTAHPYGTLMCVVPYVIQLRYSNRRREVSMWLGNDKRENTAD